MRIPVTRGAMVLALLEVGISLLYLFLDEPTRATYADLFLATPQSVIREGHVWALVTSWFLEPDFLALVMHVLVLFMFVPTLERFWGTARFLRFAAVTSLVGTIAGVLAGYAIGSVPEAQIAGLSAFVNAAIIAFGIIYAKQAVQFFAVLPLTGKQLMWGYTAFIAAFVLLQQQWALGAAYAAAMLAAALMVSKSSPGLVYRKWKVARAKRKLSVLQGGMTAPRKKPDSYLN
jgi:membrane associated rhomboid family serine protease